MSAGIKIVRGPTSGRWYTEGAVTTRNLERYLAFPEPEGKILVRIAEIVSGPYYEDTGSDALKLAVARLAQLRGEM